MKNDELVKSILKAQEEMLKYKIEANSVTLNGRKYGKLIENCPPNMKPTIFGMAVKAAYDMPDDYDFLVQYEPPQPKTNGDHIRSMTDKELATRIKCPMTSPCIHLEDDFPCLYCKLKWLKEEVSE